MFFVAPRTKGLLEKRIVIYPLKEERKSRVLPAASPPPPSLTQTHKGTLFASLLKTYPFVMPYDDNYILQ